MDQYVVRVDDNEATSLYRWLADELDPSAKVSLAEVCPGEMGAALDVVNVVLSNTIALSSLVLAVATWRDSRRAEPGAVTEIERSGVRVTVRGSSPETVRRVVEILMQPDS